MSDAAAPPDELPSPHATNGMAVVDGIEGLDRGLGRLFVVVGVFDGLHRGHEYLLRELAAAADRAAARPSVITFDHHPDEVLTGQAPPLLCDPGERLALLEAAGIAVTVVQTFDRALRETPYDAFIRRIADRVDLAGFLMTADSAFGFERRGTPETVAALGRELGYETVTVPQFTLDGEPVRSTEVRAAIGAGDLERARRLLGRPVAYEGMVQDATDDHVTIELVVPRAMPPAGRYRASITAAGAEWLVEAEVQDRTVVVFGGSAAVGETVAIEVKEPSGRGA